MTTTEWLFHAAGEPDMGATIYERPPAPCGLCGGVEYLQGLPLTTCGKGKERIKGWLKPTFTAYPLMKAYAHEAWICVACLHATWEDAVVPGSSANLNANTGLPTKKKMRNFSHLVEGSHWRPCTKAQEGRQEIRDFLLAVHAEPWAAAIATSGQKHILFLAPVNHPGLHGAPARVLVETEICTYTPADLERLLAVYEDLYTTFSKIEIVSGDYSPNRIVQFGVDRWGKQEAAIQKHRGDRLFELASFLAIRRENDGINDGCERTNQDDLSAVVAGSSAGDAASAPSGGREPAHTLGPNPGSDGQSGPTERIGAGVADENDASAPNRKPKQLSLFGD